MSEILQQLELDQTFFVQMGVFAIFLILISKFYLEPFQRLLERRKERTEKDKERAEQLLREAQESLESYQGRLLEERVRARELLESTLTEAKKQEADIIAKAREEAKITLQNAAEQLATAEKAARAKLEIEVESLAQNISERLVSRKV